MIPPNLAGYFKIFFWEFRGIAGLGNQRNQSRYQRNRILQRGSFAVFRGIVEISAVYVNSPKYNMDFCNQCIISVV